MSKKSKSLLSKILKDSTWSMIATFSNKISMVVIGIMISRYFGTEDFGRYAIIQSVVIMLANVISQSVTTATSKHIAENLENNKVSVGKGIFLTLSFCVVFSIGLILILFFAKETFAHYVLLNSEMKEYASVTIIIIIQTLFIGWLQGFFGGFSKFKTIAIINTSLALFTLLLAYILATNYGFRGAIESIAYSQLCALLIGFVFMIRVLKENNVKLVFKKSLKEINVITHVGLPILLTGIIVAPITWYSNKLLATLNNGLIELAIFSASMQWSAIFTQISVVIGTVLIPLLASKKNEQNALLEAINFYSGWFFTITISIPLLMFSDIFIKVYGNLSDNSQFIYAFSFVIFSAILTSFKSGIARKIVVLNLSWFSVLSNAAWALVFLIFSMYGKKYGAIGLTGSLFFSQLLHFIITTPYFIKRKIVASSLIINEKVLAISIAPIIAVFLLTYIPNYSHRLIATLILMTLTLVLSVKLLKLTSRTK